MSAPSPLITLPGGEGYALITEGIRLEFRHLRRDHHQLYAELQVECEWSGAQCFPGTRILDCSDLNLSSPTTRKQRGTHCAERARSKPQDFDWPGLLHYACFLVADAERVGGAIVPLADVVPPDEEADHIVHGFAVPRRDIATLVADGGKGKSTYAMYVIGELEQRGERIIIDDYEGHEHTSHNTARRMFGTVPAGFFYHRGAIPFLQEADWIRREVHRLGITYGILDSVVPACGDPAEESAMAAALLRKQREMGIGWLNIAHVSKVAERGKEKPFGSQFWWNESRSVWVLESHASNDRLLLALHHRKNNSGPLRSAVGFELVYSETRIDVKPCNVAEIAELADGLPTWQRMREELRRCGPMPIYELAENLGTKPDTIAHTARRKNLLFTRVLSPDGIQRIGLVAKG